jgi:hypothetical protein
VPSRGVKPTSTDQAGGGVGTTISPDEASSLAVDAFMFGFPLDLMDIT